MTGICHYTQSKCWLLLWRDLPFQIVSKTPTTTTFTQKPFYCSFNSIAGGDWAFQISSIFHWQSMWKGRAVQSRVPLCEFLGTPLALNCVPKSQQFPNSSILCQSDIHSHYRIFHAPASSIPYFLLLTGRSYLTFIIVLPIFLWKANILLCPLQSDLHFCDTGLWHAVQINQEEFYLNHSCIWSAKRRLKEEKKKMENTDRVRFSATKNCYSLTAFEWLCTSWRFDPCIKNAGKDSLLVVSGKWKECSEMKDYALYLTSSKHF